MTERLSRLEATLDAMAKRPFLTSTSGAFLRKHDGGVEDVAEMKDAGAKWLALNLGDDQEWEDWRTVINRARAVEVQVFPWKRCRTLSEVWELCDRADLVGFRVIANIENEFETTMPPDKVAEVLADFTGDLEVAISTVGWLYNDVDYRSLGHLPFLLQLFPQDMRRDPAELPQIQRDCCTHAREKGITHVGITCQTYGVDGVGYGKAKPEWYAYMDGTPRSLFTGDDVGAGKWGAWA